MTGLVLEGGAMRAVYTAGVLDALMDWQARVDGVMGVSAGAIHGASYVAGQRGRNIRYMTRYCADWRFMSLRSLVLTGELVGRKFSYEDIPLHLDPFDFDAFCQSGTRFYACVTNMQTGLAEYLPAQDKARCLDILRASASMPLVSRAVRLGGGLYLDGGTADSIPLRAFESMGYTRNIVVLTQPRGFVKQPDSAIAAIRAMYRRYPAFVRASEHRHESYNAALRHVRAAQEAGRALALYPSRRIHIGRMEKRAEVLRAQYALGYQDACAKKNEILAFLRG